MPVSNLTKRLINEGLEKTAVTGGRLGILAGALRDIARDMPGVRAVHKRAEMQKRAERALQEFEHSMAIGDSAR